MTGIVGTYRIRDQHAMEAVVDAALEAGYRLFDTATVYKNEQTLGEALRKFMPKYGLTRSDIFLTSKLAPKDQGYEKCKQEVSLRALGFDYIDLYLIHWPGTQKLKPQDELNVVNRAGSWKALEELYTEGKLKSIGISNYIPRHVEAMLSSCKIRPMVIQIELHPLNQERDMVALCRQHGIQIQAYSSFGEGKLVTGQVHIPGLDDVCARTGYEKNVVLLRWALEHGYGVIPKSTHPERLRENMQAATVRLTPEDMQILDAAEEVVGTTRFCWDPKNVI